MLPPLRRLHPHFPPWFIPGIYISDFSSYLFWEHYVTLPFIVSIEFWLLMMSTKQALIRTYLISNYLAKPENAQVSFVLVQTVNRHDLQGSLVTRHPGEFSTLITSYSLKTLELDLLTSRYYNIYQDQNFVSFRHSQPEN